MVSSTKSLARHFVGREAYRRTRFIVVRNAERRQSWPSRESTNRCSHRSQRCSSSSGRPSAPTSRTPKSTPAFLPHSLAPRRSGTGQSGFVQAASPTSTSSSTRPLRVTVREVVPPYPPKLLDQAKRVLGLAETLPPMELVPDVVKFDQLAQGNTATSYCCPVEAVVSPSRARP